MAINTYGRTILKTYGQGAKKRTPYETFHHKRTILPKRCRPYDFKVLPKRHVRTKIRLFISYQKRCLRTFFWTSPNLHTHILKTVRLSHSMCLSPNYTTLLSTKSTGHLRTGSIQGLLPSGLAPHRFSVGRHHPTTEGNKTNEMTSTDVSTDTPPNSILKKSLLLFPP